MDLSILFDVAKFVVSFGLLVASTWGVYRFLEKNKTRIDANIVACGKWALWSSLAVIGCVLFIVFILMPFSVLLQGHGNGSAEAPGVVKQPPLAQVPKGNPSQNGPSGAQPNKSETETKDEKQSDKGKGGLDGDSSGKPKEKQGSNAPVAFVKAEEPEQPPGTLKASLIQPLAVAKPRFVILFDGRNFHYWPDDRPSYRVPFKLEKSTLYFKPFKNPIYLPPAKYAYKDYHLRLQARRAVDLNIYVRAPLDARGFPKENSGYMVEVSTVTDGPYLSLQSVLSSNFRKGFGGKKELAIAENEWFDLELVAKGNRVTVIVNGKMAMECEDKRSEFTSGAIGLGGWCEIAKIEIKEVCEP